MHAHLMVCIGRYKKVLYVVQNISTDTFENVCLWLSDTTVVKIKKLYQMSIFPQILIKKLN